MKIIEKINAILQSEKDASKTFYSFEYFPPRTEQGKLTLKKYSGRSICISILFDDLNRLTIRYREPSRQN